jgi:hypothetical protein
MRVTSRILTAAVVLAALAGAAQAQSYGATLDGAQEVPPVPTPGTGTGTFTLDAAKMLTVHVEFSNLIGAVTLSHIHCCAGPGVNAGALFNLIPPQPASSPIDIVVGPLTPAQEASLNAGLMYVNVHTDFRTGGEIRGQIYRDTVGVESGTWGMVKQLFN